MPSSPLLPGPFPSELCEKRIIFSAARCASFSPYRRTSGNTTIAITTNQYKTSDMLMRKKSYQNTAMPCHAMPQPSPSPLFAPPYPPLRTPSAPHTAQPKVIRRASNLLKCLQSLPLAIRQAFKHLGKTGVLGDRPEKAEEELLGLVVVFFVVVRVGGGRGHKLWGK